MTPVEVVTLARQSYNAVGDDFFADAELYGHLTGAQNQLAREANVIEQTYSTTTVIDQREYDYPSATISVKRVTYNGLKLEPITFREDDAVTNGNEATTQTGTPLYYEIFDKVLYLRPIPDAAQTLKVFSFNEAAAVTATSVLDVPTVFHHCLVDYLLWRMATKDQNFQGAQYYLAKWDEHVKKAKVWSRKRARGDAFGNVQDIYALPTSYFGVM